MEAVTLLVGDVNAELDERIPFGDCGAVAAHGGRYICSFGRAGYTCGCCHGVGVMQVESKGIAEMKAVSSGALSKQERTRSGESKSESTAAFERIYGNYNSCTTHCRTGGLERWRDLNNAERDWSSLDCCRWSRSNHTRAWASQCRHRSSRPSRVSESAATNLDDNQYSSWFSFYLVDYPGRHNALHLSTR